MFSKSPSSIMLGFDDVFFVYRDPAQSTMDPSLEVAKKHPFPKGVIASKMKRC